MTAKQQQTIYNRLFNCKLSDFARRELVILHGHSREITKEKAPGDWGFDAKVYKFKSDAGSLTFYILGGRPIFIG